MPPSARSHADERALRCRPRIADSVGRSALEGHLEGAAQSVDAYPADVTLRLIGAGLPRTGTSSLREALRHLLDAPIYHMSEAFAHPEHAST